MSSRDYLLKNEKPLSEWWASVVRDPRFDKILLIAGSDIIALREADKIEGATAILESLRTMADNPPEQQKTPSSGIEHEFTKRKP